MMNGKLEIHEEDLPIQLEFMNCRVFGYLDMSMDIARKCHFAAASFSIGKMATRQGRWQSKGYLLFVLLLLFDFIVVLENFFYFALPCKPSKRFMSPSGKNIA